MYFRRYRRGEFNLRIGPWLVMRRIYADNTRAWKAHHLPTEAH